jgi:hypothetical protein
MLADSRSFKLNYFISLVLKLSLVTFFAAPEANAMPSFARQTGEACSTCHTQSFGPNLTPFGREFKLGGYTLRGGSGVAAEHPPISALVQGSFTQTNKDQPPPTTLSGSAPSGFNNNNNFSFDQAAVFYAGRISDQIGAFSQLTYNGYTDRLALDNTDIRFANQFALGGKQIIYGISVNNSPTVQDLWNTTPTWGFPYVKSAAQPTIGSVALIDGALAGQVGGATAYTMVNNLVYLEAGGYTTLANNMQKAIGVANASQQQIDGGAPYWRTALQYNWSGHYFSLGHYGMIANVFPGRNSSNGSDHYTDAAIDASYQFLGNTQHIFETKTTYIYEDQKLTASQLASHLREVAPLI